MGYGAAPISSLPRNIRQQYARSGQQQFSLWNKYYSTVRFQATVAAGFTYTFAQGLELRAFGYAVGQDMGPVGFPSGTTPATLADTNLQKPGETVAGETVTVYGISLLLTSDSDAQLAKMLWPNISCLLSLNGDNQVFKLGTPEFIPQAGGLCGFGDSYVVTPSLAESLSTRSGVLNNGLAQVANFFPFPEPIIWRPSGNADSALIVKLKVERPVVYTTLVAADRAAVAGSSTTQGTAAWNHPTGTALGTYVTVKCHLHSRQTADRSQNA
jgi:hypothetical protein